MHSKIIATACAVAAAALSAPAAAAEINFDTDAAGNPIATNTAITTQYASLGVTFGGLENGNPVAITAGPDPDGATPLSSPNVLSNCATITGACNGNRADVLQILFASGASGISFGVNSLGSGTVTFNLYDGLNNLLETKSVSSATDQFSPLSFAASGVRRIDGLQPSDSWAWTMDNLNFTISAVPEPGTWAMMLIGFGAIGFSMRNGRRSRATLAAA